VEPRARGGSKVANVDHSLAEDGATVRGMGRDGLGFTERARGPKRPVPGDPPADVAVRAKDEGVAGAAQPGRRAGNGVEDRLQLAG